MRYLIVLDSSEPGVGYDGRLPDLPGCTSAGDTLGDAINHAAEAIRGHVQTLIGNRPAGRRARASPLPPACRPAVWSASSDVDLDERCAATSRSATERRRSPATALALIDAAAKVAGTSTSAFLTRAALTYIERETAGGGSGAA